MIPPSHFNFNIHPTIFPSSTNQTLTGVVLKRINSPLPIPPVVDIGSKHAAAFPVNY